MESNRKDVDVIEHKAYARVGLLGNPSDVYYGRTISFTLANFWASVQLRPSDHLFITPHPTHDLVQFQSLNHLVYLSLYNSLSNSLICNVALGNRRSVCISMVLLLMMMIDLIFKTNYQFWYCMQCSTSSNFVLFCFFFWRQLHFSLQNFQFSFWK